MAIVPYHGSYERFRTSSKQEGVVLMSADCLVGDELSCSLGTSSDQDGALLSNRFGGQCGRLDPSGAGAVALCRAKEWDLHILLASVYAAKGDDGIDYWGEVVVVGYPKSYADSFEAFVDGVGKMLADGIRPQVDLQQSSLAQICETGGAWRPTGRVKPLDFEGSTLAKSRTSLNERMIEQARRRNPGCMIAGWAFIALLVVGVVWLAKHIFGL